MTVETVFAALAKHLGKKVVDKLIEGAKGDEAGKNYEAILQRVEKAVAAHMTRVVNWSESVQFFRMAAPRQVDDSTIALHFSSIPRKFKLSATNRETIYTEDHFLASGKNFLILGQPGAGKTTTIKRLARKLLTEEQSGSDHSQAPLLIRLNTFNRGSTSPNPLLREIANELGLRELTAIDEAHPTRPPLYQGVAISDLLPKILDELQVAVLLDGLDEVSPALRNSIEADIEELVEKTRHCKYFLTCRSGEYSRSYSYFDVVEVCNLQMHEVEDVARSWLGQEYNEFLAQLERLPLMELAQRPLFLIQMVVLYSNSGYLPSQPFEVYRMITMLMIREWDRERNLVRKSRYADFEAERKLEFLANLAFEITYKARAKSFSQRDLEVIYKKIAPKFALPAAEERLVIAEIESHTGIVAETGMDTFEFSHLTIQEYLCAYHLVRQPFSRRRLLDYLLHYPAPLAVATALSSEPMGWLAAIISGPLAERDVPLRNVMIFLDRLMVENPNITAGVEVGFCVIGLVFKMAQSNDQATLKPLQRWIEELLSRDTVKRSVKNALLCYAVVPRTADIPFGHHALRLSQMAPVDLSDIIDSVPETGSIERQFVAQNFPELMLEGLVIKERRLPGYRHS
jgi:DNA polymerase III delta prime subunit